MSEYVCECIVFTSSLTFYEQRVIYVNDILLYYISHVIHIPTHWVARGRWNERPDSIERKPIFVKCAINLLSGWIWINFVDVWSELNTIIIINTQSGHRKESCHVDVCFGLKVISWCKTKDVKRKRNNNNKFRLLAGNRAWAILSRNCVLIIIIIFFYCRFSFTVMIVTAINSNGIRWHDIPWFVIWTQTQTKGTKTICQFIPLNTTLYIAQAVYSLCAIICSWQYECVLLLVYYYVIVNVHTQ